MKKLTLFLVLPFLWAFSAAQDVEREFVVLEIATGTWCVWCPGAAGAADMLAAEGKDVAVIENHNGDIFSNVYSNARNSYYNIGGYPTTRFDGVVVHEGGQQCPPPWTGIYSTFLSKYNQRKAINSAFTLDMYGYHTGGNNYDVTINIEKVGSANTNNTVVHLVITESHIPQTWFCMTECNFVNRLMVPNQNGTVLNLNSNDEQEINLSFTLDPSWDEDHIEVVCFIQNNTSKEIYQATKKTLEELAPPPLIADFEADVTMVCETATVHFSDLSTGNPTGWLWTFPGGSPANSTQENPTVVYNTAGDYDVTLKVTRQGETHTTTKEDYIKVSANAPSTPGIEGEMQLCKNPPNTVYTATGSTGATAYDWELTPVNAGLILNDGEQSITVNWVNAYLGNASLTVKAINGCGESDLSEPFEVTISPRPTAYTMTGGGEFCEGEPGVEIGLDNSDIGVTYQLYLEDQPAGTGAVAGTGGPISFGLVTEPGIYSVVGQDDVTLCDIEMTNTATVTAHPLPVAFAITGGGAYCEGTSGVEIGLASSEENCTYELFCNDETTGITIQGTGEAISFGMCTTTGSYHAMGTAEQTLCSSIMEGATEVSIAPMPEIPPAPLGPTYVDLYYSNESEFETTGSENSNAYNWNLDPGEAGEVEILDVMHCKVVWNMSFLGEVELRTQGVNDCGESEWSDPIIVTVDNTVGFNQISDRFGIKISPNPSNGVFTIVMKSAREELISLRVVSTLNAITFEETNIPVNGSFTKTIDLSHVTDGVYFLYVETSETTYLRKLVFR